MEIIKEFIRAHGKKILWACVITCITLGIYWVYKHFKD